MKDALHEKFSTFKEPDVSFPSDREKRLEDYQAYILLRLQVFRLRLGILTYQIF